MNNETKDKIINDAIKKGFLIMVCAGCGHPYTKHDTKLMRVSYRENHDCPCGTNLIWNPKLKLTEE